MPYLFVWEPLTVEEADRLANACQTPTERLVVWTVPDAGLRVGELVTERPGASAGCASCG